MGPTRSGVESSLLEAALLRALSHEWKQLNWSHFREKLGEPTFELLEISSDLARWQLEVRTIQVARRLLLEHPWGVVVEVLKHEMAHQYVHEALGVVDQTAHGPAFRDVCARLGIDAAAQGVPVAPKAEGEQRVLDRVAKLLALAESPNEHEAHAAMAAAQKLLLKHNLEARAHTHARGYAFRHVGPATSRHGEHEKALATLLGKHFFVEAIWIPVYLAHEGKRATVLELIGTPANLEIAEYVHRYLLSTAEALWRDHKRAASIASDRDRRTYLAGVMSGFAQKLAREAQRHREEGLVWVKDGDLEAYFGKRHPRVRSFKYGGGPRREAYVHGRAAGEKIVLHRGVTSGPVARGRLLKA
ncbi:MAG: SprT-like domain-containing protein [Deltaproteobacteria bacterium]|nr:SprT-like domain-containing protein [Deltaproteobacteria bacterium]